MKVTPTTHSYTHMHTHIYTHCFHRYFSSKSGLADCPLTLIRCFTGRIPFLAPSSRTAFGFEHLFCIRHPSCTGSRRPYHANAVGPVLGFRFSRSRDITSPTRSIFQHSWTSTDVVRVVPLRPYAVCPL